jgi:hypothetical protein
LQAHDDDDGGHEQRRDCIAQPSSLR